MANVQTIHLKKLGYKHRKLIDDITNYKHGEKTSNLSAFFKAVRSRKSINTV